ncbi:MAG: nickel pincer cofactor biosynthesis protein LarB [bacterium]|jgi:NCAIR mutase (PurE)-related protein
MNPSVVKKILSDVAGKRLSVSAAMERLKHLPFEEIGHSTVDRHRALRQGFPEVIFCEGKTVDEVDEIARRICSTGENLLATRASEEVYRRLRKRFPRAVYHARGRVVTVEKKKLRKARGFIAVVSAGTSDASVAEEAAVTAEVLGNRVARFYDVGVAGLHRLVSKMGEFSKARVIIVVAGMEGALPSVVGGLVGAPVIAVPTSVGYGASFGGIAALLGMLNSCAAGVTVVNIDNGFGAGYAAALINRGNR